VFARTFVGAVSGFIMDGPKEAIGAATSEFGNGVIDALMPEENTDLSGTSGEDIMRSFIDGSDKITNGVRDVADTIVHDIGQRIADLEEKPVPEPPDDFEVMESSAPGQLAALYAQLDTTMTTLPRPAPATEITTRLSEPLTE
jgi:hypothetical protein